MQPFSKLGAVIFMVVSMVHLVRASLGWVVTINGLTVPMWISWVAVFVGGLMAIMVWRESKAR